MFNYFQYNRCTVHPLYMATFWIRQNFVGDMEGRGNLLHRNNVSFGKIDLEKKMVISDGHISGAVYR